MQQKSSPRKHLGLLKKTDWQSKHLTFNQSPCFTLCLTAVEALATTHPAAARIARALVNQSPTTLDEFIHRRTIHVPVIIKNEFSLR